jgi:hypothetical protein
MSKITRKAQKIFGGSLTASGNLAQFGSLKAAAPVYSTDPDVIQALAAFLQGWAQAVVGSNSPTMQDMNGLFFLICRQLAYLMQAGIPEWNTDTIYYIGSYCQEAGAIFRSKTDANTDNATTDTNNWEALADTLGSSMPGTAKAWCVIDGHTGTIFRSFNITSVTKNSTGTFTAEFTTALDPSWGLAGSCGTLNGGTGSAGDNNPLVGTNVRTTTHGGFRSWNPVVAAAQDTDRITAIFFA